MTYIRTRISNAYITFDVQAIDGASHSVQLYLDAATDFVVNDPNDQVVWSDVSSVVTPALPGAHVLTQSVFAPIAFSITGDENRPNHGKSYFATNSAYYSASTQAVSEVARSAFLSSQAFPPTDGDQPRASGDARMTVSAYTLDFGTVSGSTPVSSFFVYFYDEVFSI